MKDTKKEMTCEHCELSIMWWKDDEYDSYTPYGGHDEPLPEEYLCKDCMVLDKKSWLKILKPGSRGNWRKSGGEKEAAKELGLVFDSSKHQYVKATN